MTSKKADDIIAIPKKNYLPEYEIMQVVNITCSENLDDSIYVSNKYELRKNTLIKINDYYFKVELLGIIDRDQIAVSEKYRKILDLNISFPYAELVMMHSSVQKDNNYDISSCKKR